MRIFFLVACLLAVFTLRVVVADSPATQPVVIPRSEQFDIDSYAGQKHRIFIASPKEAAPAEGYAVLYVLDANAMFLTAVDAARFQHNLTPTIVVGIGYPIEGTVDRRRRFRDFSPKTPTEKIRQSASGPPVSEIVTGGEDEFLDFIDKTLKPEIARRYRVDANRNALFGHSLAGRLVLHALFTRPDSFRAYLAASPSIWWNDNSIAAEADAFIARESASARDLLITVGEMEQRIAPGTPKERAEFLASAKMVDNARELSDRLAKVKGMRVSFVEFKDENHGSVVPPAISRAVSFGLKAAK